MNLLVCRVVDDESLGTFGRRRELAVSHAAAWQRHLYIDDIDIDINSLKVADLVNALRLRSGPTP